MNLIYYSPKFYNIVFLFFGFTKLETLVNFHWLFYKVECSIVSIINFYLHQGNFVINIGDLHQFIGHCLIPLEPCLTNEPALHFYTAKGKAKAQGKTHAYTHRKSFTGYLSICFVTYLSIYLFHPVSIYLIIYISKEIYVSYKSSIYFSM